MIELTKTLCNIDSTSGNEDSIREYIVSVLDENKVDYAIDNLGNIIGTKDGKTSSKKLMLAAHMDEVGLIITSINEDGTLNFGCVGGINGEALLAKTVRINNCYGVIGSKAVHNLSADEKKAKINIDSLYIDIGTDSKEQSESLINLGDCAYFDSNCIDFGNNMLMGKAIDDRAGCAVLLKLIKNSKVGFSFAFTVQEEVGARGAGCAAFSINPDIAIVLESTTAADIPSSSGPDKVCTVGNGAVIAFMDRSTVYDKELYNTALKLADMQNIKCQVKSKIAGGNDCGAIHKTASGIRCIAISIPCRYLHTGVCVTSREDIFSVYSLTDAMLNHLAVGGVE